MEYCSIEHIPGTKNWIRWRGLYTLTWKYVLSFEYTIAFHNDQNFYNTIELNPHNRGPPLPFQEEVLSRILVDNCYVLGERDET